MRILLIGNLSDKRCGFSNLSAQMVTALRRAEQDLTVWDGTYPLVYRRRELEEPYAGFFPADVESFDVVHLIWNAMTMNHYTGAPWEDLRRAGVLTSWWDGGPSNCYCPFEEWMQVKWAAFPSNSHNYCPYPVPDWVTDLPKPTEEFTVGASSVRGDGIAEIKEICERRGWQMNLPTPGAWIPLEDEIRRLARSTVNVCWYDTPPIWKDRASAPSMLIASKRPLLINQDSLVAHLWGFDDIYHGRRRPSPWPGLETCLNMLEQEWKVGGLLTPELPFRDLRWAVATELFLNTWKEAKHGRG